MSTTTESLAIAFDTHINNITLVKVSPTTSVAVINTKYHDGDLREFQHSLHHSPDSETVLELNELFMFDTEFAIRSITFVDSPSSDDTQDYAIVTVVLELK